MLIHSQIENLINHFDSISLDEMGKVRLMNRIDMKFITNRNVWLQLLPYFGKGHLVQEVNGQRIASYHTTYYDTLDNAMYLAHHNGKKNREKIRMREYADTQQTFLEIKDKNNKGRTNKKRILLPSTPEECYGMENDFLKRNTPWQLRDLCPSIENYFKRITLVNREKTERLTIDCDLFFRNLRTDLVYSLPELVIIELKQDGNQQSTTTGMLADFHLHPAGFSKFCIGSTLTNPELKHNRFKPTLIQINKILNHGILS